MLIDEKINQLQNLIKRKITKQEIADILGLGSSQAVINRINRNQHLKEFEILKLDDFYKSEINKTNQITEDVSEDDVLLDFYPEIFGSCGNGCFELSQMREQILVPRKAFFTAYNPIKKYSVITARGNSMEPVIFDSDRLIIEHYEGEQIIDNRPYIFSYQNEIFIKRLAKNVNQLVITSENKSYDVIKLTGDEINKVFIIGQVVGLMRDLR